MMTPPWTKLETLVKLDQNMVDEAINELQTIQDLIRWAVSQFNAAALSYGQGTDNAFEDALLLILPTLYLPIDGAESMLYCRVTQREREKVVEHIKKRIESRIPSAYITNKAWFCDTEFYVDERVLVPRSPIGELIQNNFSGLLPYEPTRILDLCTGSGCIAVACAQVFPNAEIDAIDISEDALQVAEFNVQRQGLEHQVTPILSNLFEAIPEQRYDLIISNPPYVDAETLSQLPKEFSYEPQLGLEAGKDGLDLVRVILQQAARHLEEEGVLICEVGNSAMALQEAFPDLPFHWIEKKQGGISVFVINKGALDAYLTVSRAMPLPQS